MKILKKNSKKTQKFKKSLFCNIFNQNGMRYAEKEKKNLVSNSVHTRPKQENSEKNSKKIQKIKKLFPALFLAKTGCDRLRKRKKNFSPEFRS